MEKKELAQIIKTALEGREDVASVSDEISDDGTTLGVELQDGDLFFVEVQDA